MRILIDIGHPAQVHFFKHIIWGLEERGHKVKIALRNSDVAKKLLDYYGFDYEIVIQEHYKGLFKKAVGIFWIDYKIFKIKHEIIEILDLHKELNLNQ